MTPEEKSLLERTHKLAEENNEILRGIRRSNRLSLIFKIVYWVIVLGLAYGAFFLIQPYFNTLMSAVGAPQGYSGAVQSIEKAPSAAEQLKSLFQ